MGKMNETYSLQTWQKTILFLFSFITVAFGQPLWSEWLGLLAVVIGISAFWRLLLSISDWKSRFCLSMGWFTSVQLIQLAWFTSHPYLYIYGVYLFCAWLMGAQWGIISIWIKPKTFSSILTLLALSGLWTLFEWSRLFLLSGLPFNPVGLFLTNNIYSLQFSSIGGVYGLSFLVLLISLINLRAWISFQRKNWIVAIGVTLLPFVFGFLKLYFYENAFINDNRQMNVVLIQSALPIEEQHSFKSAEEATQFILDEWKEVLSTLPQHVGKSISLIALPEYLVPYGTFHHVYPIEKVQQIFDELFGNISWAYPKEKSVHMSMVWTDQGPRWFVSNSFLVQTLSNYFKAHVVIGLEDTVYLNEEQKETASYSAAFHFIPNDDQMPRRYEKRVLVPMGEYIPFDWCRELAAKYGVRGSFTCGDSAKIFLGSVPFGLSICYEEMYGHLMRENRLKGAELLVNLTNDGWYPGSALPKQHFDHARLRTVENGIPLIRACNTGVTGGIDSLGRIIRMSEKDQLQWDKRDAIYLTIPLYHYSTFYTYWGDIPIICLSIISLFGWGCKRFID